MNRKTHVKRPATNGNGGKMVYTSVYVLLHRYKNTPTTSGPDGEIRSDQARLTWFTSQAQRDCVYVWWWEESKGSSGRLRGHQTDMWRCERGQSQRDAWNCWVIAVPQHAGIGEYSGDTGNRGWQRNLGMSDMPTKKVKNMHTPYTHSSHTNTHTRNTYSHK